MKKFLCLVLSVLLILSVAPVVLAGGNITVQIDGQPIGFDVPPQIMNGRTMVPLRAIFEALGAAVNWNGDTQTVTSEKNGVSISLTINEPSMYVNGSAVALDSPACIVDGRTLVPVRAISEAFGTAVGWDGATSTVAISTSGNIEPTVTMYATDGRTIEIELSEKEAYKGVGWYEQPVTVMYAADGRTTVVAKSEVEAYKEVGWYSSAKEAEDSVKNTGTQNVYDFLVQLAKSNGTLTDSGYYFYDYKSDGDKTYSLTYTPEDALYLSMIDSTCQVGIYLERGFPVPYFGVLSDLKNKRDIYFEVYPSSFTNDTEYVLSFVSKPQIQDMTLLSIYEEGFAPGLKLVILNLSLELLLKNGYMLSDLGFINF